MIITRLINNLKCLIAKNDSLEAQITELESSQLSPFQLAIVDVDSNSEVAELPLDIQIVSIMLMRTTRADEFQDFSISHYTQSVTPTNTVIAVSMTGNRLFGGYQIYIVYRFL